MATFTAGTGVGARSGSKSASLEDFGFKPRGTDTVPAMLSPNEYIVNKKGARDNRQTLDSINKGYYRGGMVKPAYLASGTKPMEKPSVLGWVVNKTFGATMDVGGAADFVSEKIKDSSATDQVVKALSELGEDIKESLRSSADLVDEVRKAADAMSKVREAPKKAEDFSSLQREQTKILSMILKSRQRTQTAKMATFMAGTGVGARSGSKSASLEDFGFKPRGTDTVPAMLSPNEYIVNKKGARDNRQTLDSINKGYYRGGMVKPAYLASGTKPMEKPSVLGWVVKKTFGATLDVGGAAEETAEDAKKYEDLGRRLAENLDRGFKEEDRKGMAKWMTGVGTLLVGGKSDFLGNLFAGTVTDITNFNREMRSLAFETQGITGSTRDLQAQFADVGTSIKETGKSIDLVQRLYMSNLRKGFRIQKDGLKVVKSGLFLSTMIGSEASQTADMFADWNRMLGMSARQMDRMAHDTKEIARSTGVTGDELLSAMKSSEGILKNLRGQGNLTSGAAKNVITAMAEAKKLGIEEPAQRILGAMGGTNPLLEADNKTQNFVFQYAGRMGKEGNDAAIQGTLLKDKRLLKRFVAEMDTDIAQMTGGRAKNVAEIERLSEEERTTLAIAIKAKTGLDLYEFKSMHDVLEMSSKSLADKLNELGKEVVDASKTESERNLARQQMEDLQMSAGLGFISKLSEQAEKKGSGSFGEVADKTMADFKGDERADFDLLLKSMDEGMKAQINGLSGSQKDFAAMSLVTAKRLQEQGKAAGLSVEDFGSEMLDAIKSGDKKRIGDISDEMEKAADIISVYSKASGDPTALLALQLSEMNENVRKFFAPLISGVIDLVGANGLLMVQLGLASAAIYESFGKMILDKLGFARLFPSMGRTAATPARAGLGWRIPAEDSQPFFKALAKSFKEKLPKVLTKYFYKPIQNVLNGAATGVERIFNGVADLIDGLFKVKFWNVLTGAFDIIVRAAGKVRAAWSGFYSTVASGLEGMRLVGFSGFRTGIGRALTYLMNIPSRIMAAFRGSSVGKVVTEFFSGIGRFLTTGFREALAAFRVALSGGFTGLIRGLGGLLTGGLRGLGKLVAVGSGPGAIVIASIFAVIDGIMGAFQGFQNAGKIFDGVIKRNTIGIKELTTGMKASAAAGGALAGALDGFLFGALSLLGLRGTIEKFFSQLIYAFVVLGQGIYEGFMSWMPEISKSMTALGNAFLGIWNSIMSLFGMNPAADMSDAFNQLYAILKPIGYVLGSFVGGSLTLLINGITVLAWGVQGLVQLLDGLADVLYVIGRYTGINWMLGVLGRAIWSIGVAAWTVGSHIYSFFSDMGSYIEKMIDGVCNQFSRLVTDPVNYILEMGHAIGKAFYDLGVYLIWGSVVTDMCSGIMSAFAKMAMNVVSGVASMVARVAMFFLRLPFTIIGGLASLAGNIAMFFLKLPFKVMGGLFNAFVKWPIKMMYRLMNFMTGGLLGKSLEGMASLARSFFDSILKGASNALKMGYKIMNFLSGGWLDVIVSGLSKIGGKIVTLVDDYLTKPIVGAFTYIAEKISGLLNKIPIPKWLMGGGNTAAAAGGAAAQAAGASNDVARAAGAASGAAKAVGAADDVVKVAAAATNPFSGMGGAMGSQAAKTASASASASMADDAAKLVLASANDLAQAAPKALGFFGKAGGLVSGLAKKAPILGPMLDFGIRKATGQSTGKAAVGTAAGAAGGVLGGMGGASLGSLVGGGLGALIGSIVPVAGTAAGAAAGASIGAWLGGGAGAIAGGVGGGMLADKAYDAAVGPSESQIIGNEEINNEDLLQADQQMITQGAMQLRQGEVMENTLAMGAHPGSMYVHDVHTEALLYLMWNLMRKDEAPGAFEEFERKMKENNQLISILDGTLGPMAERATKKGSIYTHDVHVEKELKDVVGEDKKGGEATPVNADTALKEATAEIDNKLKSGDISQQATDQTYINNMLGDLEGLFSGETAKLTKAAAEARRTGDATGAKKFEEDLKKLDEQRKSLGESLRYVAASNEVMNQKQMEIYELDRKIAQAKATGSEDEFKSLSEDKASLESAMRGLESKKAEHVRKIEGQYGDNTVKSFEMQKGVTGFRMEGDSRVENLKEFHDAKVRAGQEEKMWDMMTDMEKQEMYGSPGVGHDKIDFKEHMRQYKGYVPDENVLPVEKWTPEMRNANIRRERDKMMQKEAEMHSTLTEEQSKALLKERSDFAGSRPGGVPTRTGTWSDVTEVSDITTPKLKEAADRPYMETHEEAYAREGRELADSQKRLEEMTAKRAAAERRWYEIGSWRSDQAKASLPKDLNDKIEQEKTKSAILEQRQKSGTSMPSTKSPFEKDENGRIVESNELGLRRERKEMEESQARLKELQSKKDALGPAHKTWGDFFSWRGDDRANKAKEALPYLEKNIFKEEVRSRALKAHQGMGEPMRKRDWTGSGAEGLDTSTMEAQGQTQIDQLAAVENMADHATKAGSIFTHDIHTEGLLNSLLNNPETAGASGALSMSKQMNESVGGDIGTAQKMIEAIAAEHGNLVYPEIKPRRPEATDAKAWKPIAIPEKDPATMARFEAIQREMMQSGLEIPLIPSSTSSLNITDAEREAANAMEAGSIAYSTPVGQHAVPILRAEEDADVNGVQPVHLRDITESILRDKVGADAGTNKVQSDELARMEKVANDQYAELQQIREGIQEMVTLLKPSGTNIAGDSEMAAGRTKDPRKPYHASIYGKMKYGQPGGNANRAVVNDGMC
jgi:hypothetical protein